MRLRNFLTVIALLVGLTTPAFSLQEPKGDFRLNAVNIDWWDNFGDEHLKGYILKTIENNHDLKIATLKTQEYEQFVKVTRAGQLPALNLSGNYNRIRTPEMDIAGAKMDNQTMNMFMVPLVASYEADIFLKNADKTKSAKKQLEAARHSEKSTYITLVTSSAATYLNIVRLDALIEKQEKITANREKIHELTKMRSEDGLSSVYEVTMSDKLHTMARISLNDLKKEREILLNQLAVLIGESPTVAQELKRAKIDEIEYKALVPIEISSEVILQRPDIMKAEADLARAGIDVRVARKEFLPTIPITGVFGFNSSGLGSLFNWEHSLAMIAGGLTQNLFTGGIKTANLKTKKIQYDELFENYKKADLVAIQEVNDALCKIKFDTNKDSENINKYDLENKNFKLIQEKYKEGVISYLDLIQHEENLLALSFDTTSSKIGRLVDYLGLYKAVGGAL